MIELLAILLLIIIFYAHSCFGEIIKTNNFNVIENKLQFAGNETLIIFDVDDVLFQPKDQILVKRYLQETKKKIAAHVSTKEFEELYSIIFLESEDEPVDLRMKELISKIQKNGTKVLALTNCFTGSYGRIPSMEDWRIEELKDFGYYFDKSWKNISDRTFDHILSEKHPARPAAFKKGVIFTSNSPKGVVLKAFLSYAKLNPKHIIFIDDNREYIKSVQQVVKKMNIKFTAIEYTAVESVNIQPLDKKRADLQLDILEKEHRWISDTEADEYLKSK